MSKVVSVIPAKPLQVIRGLPVESKKRVCAYCRVSTDTDEQLSSYEAQVTYYEEYIKKRPDWEFAGIYADEGITGTNTKNRTEFNRMIDDCLTGRIDLIVTKSISRFARNTLDCLKYVRMLKDKGVAIFFEKENIDTMDSKGEVLLTILSSLAQDESRSISENSRWGIVRRFQQGKVRVNHKKFIGYDKDENGELVINKQEAAIVRRIFAEYLAGKGCKAIGKGLERDGVLTATGKKVWHESVIKKMLQNEKYAGDALLQKTITVDFLTHKRVINKGYVPQYFVENNHPAIIAKETFKAVQTEMERRSELMGGNKGRSRYTNKYPFSGKIFCNECGAAFRRKSWGTGKYKKYVWICRTRDEQGPKGCSIQAVDEEKLQEAFVRVVNQLISDRDTFIARMTENIEKVFNEQASKVDVVAVDRRLEELRTEMAALVKLNLTTGIDDEIYGEEYRRIAGEIEVLRSRRAGIMQAEMMRQEMRGRLREIAMVLRDMDGVREFDEELFGMLVERVRVINLVQVEFVLRSGVGVVEIL
ncbi:recombinase family protein [Anaeroselena agilis]|uniref:Recombinase family protein n=1 Tax=Anaeroselena agilis TaxID=3063788 RepID=A0ABU3NUC5_9FIRM|nr:recombinase family protein [Selenomonadales bacterium 4137-cl]